MIIQIYFELRWKIKEIKLLSSEYKNWGCCLMVYNGIRNIDYEIQNKKESDILYSTNIVFSFFRKFLRSLFIYLKS